MECCCTVRIPSTRRKPSWNICTSSWDLKNTDTIIFNQRVKVQHRSELLDCGIKTLISLLWWKTKKNSSCSFYVGLSGWSDRRKVGSHPVFPFMWARKTRTCFHQSPCHTHLTRPALEQPVPADCGLNVKNVSVEELVGVRLRSAIFSRPVFILVVCLRPTDSATFGKTFLNIINEPRRVKASACRVCIPVTPGLKKHAIYYFYIIYRDPTMADPDFWTNTCKTNDLSSASAVF